MAANRKACVWTFIADIFLVVTAEQSLWWSFLEAWDLRDTSRRLFSTTADPGSLPCLHGLRACSMLWILLGHRASDVINGPLSNQVPAMTVYQKPLAMTVVNSYVAVDTFLLLSGLLVCWTSLRDIRRHGTFRLPQFYLYRYLRLSVPYATVILYYVFIQSYVGYGPLWRADEGCRNYWWSALTYTQNYNEFGKYCMTQTWYLSVDMQLAFLSPLIIIPLYYSKKAGIQLVSLLILISCFIPFTVANIYELFWAYHGTNLWDNYLYTTIMYFPTHTRASPYLCGVLLGYFLFRNAGTRISVPRPWLVFGWCLSTLTCLTIVFSLCLPYQPGFTYHKLDSAFYNGFHHIGWAAALSWVIFACVNGQGGVVDRLLSWRFFLPLSRLTYAAYLSQFIVITFEVGNLRVPNHFTVFAAVRKFLGDLPMVLALSTAIYVTVEAPLMVVLKKAFGRKAPKSEQSPPIITVTHVN